MLAATPTRFPVCLFAGMAVAALVSLAAPAQAQPAETPPVVAPAVKAQVLLSSRTTGDGQPLVYPTGEPLITSRVVEIPPGGETGRHRHLVPLFAYILEGELTIHPDDAPPRRFKAGEGFMETAGWHNGRNETDRPVRLLSVYSGAVDVPLSVKPTP